MTSSQLQLRAMNVGELLDTTFRLYRRHFWLFIGIVAVVQIPLTLLGVTFEAFYDPSERIQAVDQDSGNFWAQYEIQDEYYEDVGLVLAGQFAMFMLNLFAVQGLMNGAMARAVYDHYLGRPRGLADTYRALGWGWLRLAIALMLLFMLDIGVGILLILMLATGSTMLMCLFCIGWIAALVFLTYINVPILSLLAPAIIIENKGVLAGLRRSFELGRRKFWRVLGINFLLALLAMVVTMPFSFALGMVSIFWNPDPLLTTAIASSINLVVTLLVTPVRVCGLTLLYFDLRVRLEGFDLELQVEQMDAGAMP